MDGRDASHIAAAAEAGNSRNNNNSQKAPSPSVSNTPSPNNSIAATARGRWGSTDAAGASYTPRQLPQREEIDDTSMGTAPGREMPQNLSSSRAADGTVAPAQLNSTAAPRRATSAATSNAGGVAGGGPANDSLAESFAGSQSLARPLIITPNSARNNAAAMISVPPTSLTATPVVTSNKEGITMTMPNGDSFAFPPDLYDAVKPMRKRSALITGAKPYQAVADDPRAARSRSYLVRIPPQQAAQNRQQQQQQLSPGFRGPQGDEDPFSPHKASPRGGGSKGTHSPDGGSTTTVAVNDGGAATSNSFIPPTAFDPNELPSLPAAYLRGDVRADLLSANDPINNYTFFIGGSDSDEGEDGNDSDGERSGNRQGDAISQAARRADGSFTNPLSFDPGSPHQPYGKPNHDPDHVPFGSAASEDSFASSGTGQRAGNTGGPCDNGSGGSSRSANTPALRSAAASPSGGGGVGSGPQPLDLNEAAALVESLSRSFALNRQQQQQHSTNNSLFDAANATFHGVGGRGAGSPKRTLNLDPLPAVQEEMNRNTEPINNAGNDQDGNAPLLQGDGKPNVESYIDMDAFARLPMPRRELCHSRADLDDDTVSFSAMWQSIKSETFSRHVLFGFRVTVFAVLPMFVLTKHPNTKDFFAVGALVPIVAGLFVRPNLGAQVLMTVLAIQACICFLLWGTIMNAVGAVHHVSGWWCAVIFGSFVPCMFGDMLAKRLMMMYIVIVMQMEHTPGGDEVVFPSRFAKDFLIAAVAGFIACLLPFPILAVRQVSEALVGLHKLYGAGVGNAMKAYWAPVNIDQKAALSQVPFPKIRELTGRVRELMFFTGYEPTEFNLNNILRGERLGVLQRVKMHIYQMSAAASQRIAEGQQFSHRLPKEMRDFEKRVRGPAMELATDIIDILSELGKYITPSDVATRINYDSLYNKASILADIVDRERAQVFFLRKDNAADTNSYLRTFAFLGSLVDIAAEIEKLEIKMRDFDPSKYPSFWQRSWNFIIGDMWRDFWAELPKRLTLATPRDVRLLKDSIRYTLGFAVACAFTLNFDHSNVYYFGMAILVRLAQQTASETLSIGIYRICGLAIGASISYITYTKTHNLAEETLLTMTFVFIFMCFASHPIYQWGAQYCMVISITGLSLAGTPSLLLVRMVDNVFAFISYFLICSFLFPVDPIRVLWNTRTRIFLNLNALMQSFVTLGCAPITVDGAEAAMFLTEAKKLTGQQALLLKAYGDWMVKCTEEPTIRGGVYPNAAVVKLLLYLNEAASLEEAMLDAMVRLHRVRPAPPSVILSDVMELTRPFLQDVGKIMQRYFQNMIDATEVPKTWSMETALNTLWRGQIACRSLRSVTGNIQRNFYAAVQQVGAEDKHRVNVYLPSSMVFEALAQEDDPRLLNPENEDLLKRLFAMSFHMSQESLISRDDMQAFNAIVTFFELMFKVLEQMLPYIVEIHEFEKSRVI